MALWCRDVPLVKVIQAAHPKPVTLIVPYYEQPVFYRRQLDHWATYPEDVRRHLSIIVVDDGSPTFPASGVPHAPLPLRVFRIQQDVRWNWLAARNIGFHHAAEGWCLVTDMDHVVPAETLRACITGAHDPRTVYCFARAEHTGIGIHPHSASFFLTRKTFWKSGGYDETLSGHYGTDGDFRRRLRKVAPFALVSDRLIRHEYVDDSSVTRYQRKQPEDATVKRLVAARTSAWKPRTLSFPYAEVTA